jgi:hypothetical protein
MLVPMMIFRVPSTRTERGEIDGVYPGIAAGVKDLPSDEALDLQGRRRYSHWRAFRDPS